MKGLDIGNKRLKHNIVDLFPGTQTDPDRQMKPSRWMHVHTHTHAQAHTYKHYYKQRHHFLELESTFHFNKILN